MIVFAFVLVLVGFALVQNGNGSVRNEQIPEIGFQAPEIQLEDFEGNVHSLSGLQGVKPVVVNFWASWCGPCRIEAPELVSLYKTYGTEIEILAVNLTAGDSVEGAKAFAEEFKFTFPVLLDKEGEVEELYRIKGVPTTYFINKEGIIQDVIVGLASSSALQTKFRELLP